jgi:hypothetical protein
VAVIFEFYLKQSDIRPTGCKANLNVGCRIADTGTQTDFRLNIQMSNKSETNETKCNRRFIFKTLNL